MNKSRYLIAFIILLSACTNFEPEQMQTLHHNHQVFEINKLKPHADFFAFANADLAHEAIKYNSGLFKSLNGDSKLQWIRNPKDRLNHFYDTTLNIADCKTSPVPSNWELECYGNPIYLDERYPFEEQWPNTPDKFNPIGTYRHSFEIPADWKPAL